MCLLNNLIPVLPEIQEIFLLTSFLKFNMTQKFKVNIFIISIFFSFINDRICLKKCRRKLKKKIKRHLSVVLFGSHSISGILTKNYYDLNLLNKMCLSTASLKLSWYEHHEHKSIPLGYFNVFV